MFAILTLVCHADMPLADEETTVMLNQPPTIGIGSLKCSEWKRLSSNSSNQLGYSPTDQWIMGLVSGYNLFFKGKKNSIYLPQDEKNILNYLTSYCELHPELLISEAANNFLMRSNNP